MIAKLLALIVGISVSAPLAQQPPAKPQDKQQAVEPKKPDAPAERASRVTGKRDHRAGRLLPSAREEMQFERWILMAVRTYELTEDQEKLVRQEVAAIRRERKESMGEEAEEYQQLKRELDAMFEATVVSDDSEIPTSDRMAQQRDRRRSLRRDPAYLEIQKRMREIEQKYALDMDAYVLRIEKLLPAEQVRKAAEQRQAMKIRRDRRRAEQSRLRDVRRAERAAAREGKEPRISPPEKVAKSSLEPAAKPEAGGPAANEPKQDSKAAEADVAAAAEAEAARQAQASADEREKNMHPWEKHVRAFIQMYELTPRQANAAMSILQDSLKREEQYIRTYADRIEAAKKITDKAKQDAELAKLEQPRQYIFKELTKRLDSLLTAGQRAKIKAAETKKEK